MTPPESPRDRDGASVASVDMSADISGSDQKHREQGQGQAFELMKICVNCLRKIINF